MLGICINDPSVASSKGIFPIIRLGLVIRDQLDGSFKRLESVNVPLIFDVAAIVMVKLVLVRN